MARAPLAKEIETSVIDAEAPSRHDQSAQPALVKKGTNRSAAHGKLCRKKVLEPIDLFATAHSNDVSDILAPAYTRLFPLE